jgi:cytochrome P450
MALMYSLAESAKLNLKSCGLGRTTVLSPSNDDWRQQRKLISHDLAPRLIPRYHAFQEAEARLLVKNIIEEPSELDPLIQL